MVDAKTGRAYLRFTTDRHDPEILEEINAAVLDLQRAGLAVIPEEDSLVNIAIKLWLRWHFNFCGRGPEYERNYRDLRAGLALQYPDEKAGGACE